MVSTQVLKTMLSYIFFIKVSYPSKDRWGIDGRYGYVPCLKEEIFCAVFSNYAYFVPAGIHQLQVNNAEIKVMKYFVNI